MCIHTYTCIHSNRTYTTCHLFNVMHLQLCYALQTKLVINEYLNYTVCYSSQLTSYVVVLQLQLMCYKNCVSRHQKSAVLSSIVSVKTMHKSLTSKYETVRNVGVDNMQVHASLLGVITAKITHLMKLFIQFI